MIRKLMLEAAVDEVSRGELEYLKRFINRINSGDRIKNKSYTVMAGITFALTAVFLLIVIRSRSYIILDMSLLFIFLFIAVSAVACLFFLAVDTTDRINISLDKVMTYPYKFTYLRKQPDHENPNSGLANYVFKVSGDLGTYVLINTEEKGFFFDTLEKDKKYVMYAINDKYIIFVKMKRKKTAG